MQVLVDDETMRDHIQMELLDCLTDWDAFTAHAAYVRALLLLRGSRDPCKSLGESQKEKQAGWELSLETLGKSTL